MCVPAVLLWTAFTVLLCCEHTMHLCAAFSIAAVQCTAAASVLLCAELCAAGAREYMLL